jgi:putative transposase
MQMDIRAQSAILCAVQKFVPTNVEGRPRSNPVDMLDFMCHILWTGAPWRSLGKRFSTVHGTFIRWSRAHVFEIAYRALLKLERRTTSRKSRFACIDSSFVKNIYGRDCVGRNPTDRGRNATKVSALVDQDGIPLSLVFFPGNVSDQRTVQETLSGAPNPARMTPLYADKGYDSKENRRIMRSFGYVDRVSRRGEVTHRLVNRRRNVVERTFSWLDKCRRLILRYDMSIVAYASWTWLGCIKLIAGRLLQSF